MNINNNLVDYIGGGVKLIKSYSEIISPQPQDTRTADEVINGIVSRLNGTQNEFI